MLAGKGKVDKPFLFISVILIVAGFFIFSSASLGLLAKESSNYSDVAFTQMILGLFLGTVAMIVASRLDFKVWKRFAFWFFLFAIILNILKNMLLPIFSAILGILAFLPFKFFWPFGFIFLVPLFVFLIKEAELIDTGWTIDEAIRLVISAGIIGPEEIKNIPS